ncbi:hypothetical protein ACNQGB_13875 [Flavobacterium sp. XS1P32]|uniref:Uncharacterized protein n=1 Tax=Flavobacterium tiangeerense TaxID=459471 RepID=A0ABY3FNQ3_9FLAO|nr:hypothetical protein [Flavobacterium tiangeerense]TWI03398.1 hypothetical protein IQ05_00343 [Flavobacterium tiangeerense]
MKNTLIFIFILFCSTINAQISSYNKGLKSTTFIFNNWFLNKGVETFATKPTPVGYKQSYDELKNVLAHFDLDIMEAEVDKSLIDKNIDGLRDFHNLSISLFLENSVITMAWRTNDNFQIFWGCTNEMNIILINKLK